MHEMAIKVFAIFLIHLVVLTYTTDLEDETTSLFLGETPNKIVIGAYGDYNADKLVDIFITSDQGRPFRNFPHLYKTVIKLIIVTWVSLLFLSIILEF